jgi:ParB-like nuclease domain
MSPSQLKVTYEAIQNLVPYARNARTHSQRQIRQIADSMRTFGFTNPVLVNGSRMIIAGHGPGLPPLINLYIPVETKFSVHRLGFNLPQHNADALHPLGRELDRGNGRLLHIA